MSSVYGELKEDVLPKLRRAQLVNNMEITGKSDAEMQALVNSGKLDELNNEELLHVATLIEDNALKVKVLEYAAKKYDDSRATHDNVSRVFFAAFSDGCAGKGIVLPFAGLRLKKRGENLE